ncbi:hypothetical protein [Amycolatopsis pigmentata]|uniref:THD domain-containing protein n=1 Tax=Amycolatopsis pigmentata TaxID=450801 RepID=A0ABW5G3U3_9PSEU
MATPTPAIPTFTDGQIVHATDLNALASNLTNLYNYNQASFTSQRPCVIAKQTTAQGTTAGTFTTANFQAAVINTDNMWTASVPNQVTIQHAGIYYVFSQTRYPTTAYNTANAVDAYILANGTAFSNSITGQSMIPTGNSIGTTIVATTITNLAAGSTLYLGVQTNFNFNLDTGVGGSFLGAIFLTSST